MTNPLSFDDFSGGITDYFVGAPLNKFEDGDNLTIFKYADSSKGFVGRLFTRPGSTFLHSATPQIPLGSTRVGSMEFFDDKLLVQAARKIYDASTSSLSALTGPTGNEPFPSGFTVSNYVTYAQWKNHLLISSDAFTSVQKVYLDGLGVLSLRTAGLPALSSVPTVTHGSSGSHNYLYRFYYEYTHQVGSLTYVDVGPMVEVALTNSADPGSSAVAVTSIPVLSNGAVSNYDTATVKVRIARTASNGQTFYLVGSVTNGTTSFSDNVSDASLQQGELLYTEDGSVERFPPPLCKYVHATEDKAYFAHVKEGSEVLANRVFQSIPGDLDSVGEDFYCDVDFPITGISSHKGVPVVGTEKGMFRIEGTIDQFGRGAIFSRRISDVATCVSAQSMVQTPYGIFWAGREGIYWSDGYNCFRVNDGWDRRFKNLVGTPTKEKRITAKYDSVKNRVYFAVSSGSSDNNLIYALHCDWGVSTDMPFTTWSGASLTASALEVTREGDLIRGDARGYLYKHSETIYSDRKYDAVLPTSQWVDETIIYNFKSAATNFGSSFERKWVTAVNIVAENETNLSLAIISNNDKSRKRKELSPVRFRGNLIWGEVDVFWGDQNIIWNYAGLISEKRRMPAGHLRCDYKQLELTNAKVALFSSDLLGTVDVDATLKTATLTLGPKDWPVKCVDYFIAFEADGYTREYLITSRTDDVVTFTDPGNTAQTLSGQRWVIRGKPSNEVLFLIGFNLHFEMFGKTQGVYRNSQSGEVGA